MAKDEAQRELDMQSNRISGLGDPTTAGDATKTDNTTTPAAPAASAAAGSSLKAAPADHVHQGVHSLHADASANVYGDVRLVSGSGITLSQSGQDITVAASGAATNKIALADAAQRSVTGTTEEIVAEYNVRFSDAAVGNIQVRLSGIVKCAAGNGTFKVYTGATSVGSLTGGTARATITTTNTSFEKQTNLGSAFTNPSGSVLVQVTAVNDTASTKSTIRGFAISIG
jgi:hypothetical protein